MGAEDRPPTADGALRRGLESLAARPLLLYGAALGSMGAIAAADWMVGDEVLLFVFQAVPVGVLAWGRGLAAGLSSAALAGALVLATNASRGGLRTIDVFHALITFVATGAFAWAVARVKADRLRIEALLDTERRLSREDPLTSLASARAFHERIGLELERMRRRPRPLSLLYLDLDDFKRVNDERGHSAGDELLARVGRLLQGAVRRVDLCARLGGDEFAVLMPETSAEEAAVVAARIREATARSFQEGGAGVGMSAGLATFESAPVDAHVPLNQVDQLMYEAKRAGKGRIVARTLG